MATDKHVHAQIAGPDPGRKARLLFLKMMVEEDKEDAAAAGPGREPVGALGRGQDIDFSENEVPSGKTFGASFHFSYYLSQM